MGRYDQNKSRKNKPSRYDTESIQQTTRVKSGGFSVVVVIMLLIVAVIVGFCLAKLSDGERLGDLLASLQAQVNGAGSKDKTLVANANTVPKAVPVADHADNLQYTQAQEQIILPSLDSSDDPVREALTAVSPNIVAYLKIGQIIRSYMLIANDFAQGYRIAKHLGFFHLQQPFTVDIDNGQLLMSAQDYQRYDNLAQMINSIDIPVLLNVYKKFRPLLLQVFSEFSYPDGYNLDDIFINAAKEIFDAPIIDKKIPVIKTSSFYKFADPELEALNGVHKQMLRMGGENTRLIQAKVRLLLGELVNSKP